MQSITVARYAVLAFTFTAIAAIMAGIFSFGSKWVPLQAAFIGSISIAIILLPSLVISLTLSTQFHRLSAYNAIFGEPMSIQQKAFEIYRRKRPHFWGYVKPLAFAYTLLLVLVSLALLITFWSCTMVVAMLLLVGAHVYPLVKLWDAGLAGRTREKELELWREIKTGMEQSKGK
jgi:ABC-type uncharacterized transport system permease subunit